MYVSLDNGGNWQSLQLNMPVAPITDLVLQKRDKDLVVATQGRSFYVLEDLAVLHYIHDTSAKGDVFLFPPEEAYRTAGRAGAVIPFYMKEAPKGEVVIEILDSAGKQINLHSSRGTTGATAGGADDEDSPRMAAPRLTANKGINRFTWDLRHHDAVTFPGLIMWAGSVRGPKAAPGKYQVRLTVDGQTFTQPFELKKDPRLTSVTQEDLDKQQAFSLQLRDKLSDTHKGILRLRDTRYRRQDQRQRATGRCSEGNSFLHSRGIYTEKTSGRTREGPAAGNQQRHACGLGDGDMTRNSSLSFSVGEGSTSISSPRENSAVNNFSDSGSSMYRWMALLSGRAP